MGLGDIATVTVKKGTPDMRKPWSGLSSSARRRKCGRPNGIRVSLDDNAVVVVDEKNEPKGTEIKGPVAR